jgi:hypothetical protein
MSIKELSQQFIGSYEIIIEGVRQQGREALNKVFRIFWDNNPEVNVIVWKQYAPHFNDGDPCIFSVHDLTFSNLTDQTEYPLLDYGEYEGEDENVWAVGCFSKNNKHLNIQQASELEHFLHSSAMTNVMKTIFGEESRVVATREGFTSEYCEAPY